MKEQMKRFEEWIKDNRLLRIVKVQPKAGRNIIIGRLMKYEMERGSLLIYEDDRKQVVHLLLNEIDSIEIAD